MPLREIINKVLETNTINTTSTINKTKTIHKEHKQRQHPPLTENIKEYSQKELIKNIKNYQKS